jgi:hypothetical protein
MNHPPLPHGSHLVEKLVEREGGAKAFVVHAAREKDRPSGSIAAWAAESWSAARGGSYRALPIPVACGGGPTSVEEVDPAYERAAEPIVRSRLILAGERLAMLLNDALGSRVPAQKMRAR